VFDGGARRVPRAAVTLSLRSEIPMPRPNPLVVLVALLLAACGEARDASPFGEEGEAVQGGTAVVSRVSDFDAFNQFVSTDYDTGQVLRYMLFMPLVRLDEQMNYEPFLAESATMSEDGRTLTFRLRDGVTWHDGTPVTADDVVWSVETYMNPDLAFANVQYFQFVDRVEQTDDRTVVFHFNAAHSDALADFLEWEPKPRHLLGEVGVANMRNATFNRNPVGNGPFRFVSWTANQQVVFEANPDFVLGRPNLDRVVFRIIPEQTTELTELLTGRLDLIRAVLPAEAPRVENNDGTRLITYPSRSYTYLAWNTQNPLFQDPRVRRALTLAIDRRQIVDALLYGYATLAVTDVLPFQWQFDEQLEPWQHDPEQARRLLAEAGWTPGPDGILRNAQGQPFRFTLETNQGNDLRSDILVIVQSDLRRVGIDVQPRLAEWNSLIDRLKQRNFQAVVSGWSVDFKFDPTEVLGCEAGVYNYPAYCNPRADSLVQAALTTLDPEQARPLWEEYQQIIHREQPYTFLYYLDERLGVSERLRGVVGDARGHLVSIEDWWVRDGR
jgi:peptide/nickel transport system substrate-binding protein